MDASMIADMENESARSMKSGKKSGKGGKKMFALLALCGLAAGGYYAWEHTDLIKPRNGVSDLPSASLFLNADHTSNAEPVIADPIFYSLEPFVVNLSDPDSDKYLQVTLVYNLTTEDVQKSLEKFEPMLRSRILMALGSKTLSQVKSLAAKQALMDEMLEIARLTMARSDDPSKGVRDVHFSTYIVQ